MPTFPSPRPTILPPEPLPASSEKNRQTDRTKQDTLRQYKSPHIGSGQGNPIGGKESQQQAKESEIHLFPLLVGLQNTQLTATGMCRGTGTETCNPGAWHVHESI